MKLRLLCLTIGALLVFAGCGSDSDDSASGGAAGDVAAMVNGTPITVTEVQKVTANLKRQNIAPDSTVAGATEDERLYRTALERLVEQQLLVKAAEDMGITISDEEIQGNVAQLQMMAGGAEAFQKLLAENGATEADVVRDMRTNLLLKEYFDKVVDQNPEISDDEVAAYYDEHNDQYGPQPEAHARHILIRTDPSMDDMAKAAARQKITDALTRIRNGEDFAAVAAEVSEDPTTAGTGGDLQWFGRGQMVPAFDTAAFTLEPGQVSDVVETQYGYHVLKVDERRMAPAKTLDEVNASIRNYLAQTKAQTQFRAVVDGLRDKAKIDIKKIPEGLFAE